MSTAAKEIIEAALKLGPVERERIAETLWQSLEDPAAVETTWSEEIQRRIMAADANQIDSASWEETRDELIAELRQVHPRGR
jgi:putative addiction module component (TIGR02574 family)